MEYLLFVILIIGAIYYFRKKMNANKSESLVTEISKAGDLQKNDIDDNKLSVDQLKRIKVIQESIIEVNNTSLEETIKNFNNDTNPENEIKVWEAIVGTYQKIIQGNPNFSPDEKQESYNLLLMRSMMSSEKVIEQVSLTTMAESKALELLSLYSMEAKPFIIVNK